MIGITTQDYLLLPVYLVILSYIARQLKKRYADNKQLQFYFTWGFRIKIIISIIFTLLTHYVIRGDSADLYFGEGKHFAEIIYNNPSQADLLFTNGSPLVDNLASDEEKGYLLVENNYMVVKIAIVLCFLTFSKFLLINLIISFMAFLGSWRLFLFFYKLYPSLHRQLAIACMAIPTVVFWSCGIGKDAICIAALGFLTKSLYDLIIDKRKILANALIVVIASFLIYRIKPYIILSYLPLFFFFLAAISINKTHNSLLKVLLKISIPLIFIIMAISIYLSMDDLFDQFSSDHLLESIKGTQSAFNNQSVSNEGSFYSIGDFDGTLGSLVTMAPAAIGTALFRPFIWESKNIMMLLSAFECLVLFWLTIRNFFSRKRIISFFTCLFKDPCVTYCMIFSLAFAAFVGLTTFNFGSMARYKIPCLPFFVIALIIIGNFRKQETGSTV